MTVHGVLCEKRAERLHPAGDQLDFEVDYLCREGLSCPVLCSISHYFCVKMGYRERDCRGGVGHGCLPPNWPFGWCLRRGEVPLRGFWAPSGALLPLRLCLTVQSAGLMRTAAAAGLVQPQTRPSLGEPPGGHIFACGSSLHVPSSPPPQHGSRMQAVPPASL